MRDTGVRVLDIEFVQIRPDTDVDALRPFLETGAALGAAWVIAAPYDPDLRRLADRFARLCDLAPGDGSIDLASLIAAMPSGIPLALEVPMTATPARIGPGGVARHVRQAAERVSGDARSSPAASAHKRGGGA